MRRKTGQCILQKNIMERKFINMKRYYNKDFIFYLLVFILFYLLDRFCTFTTDDYRYLVIGGMSGGINGINMPVESFKDIIISQIYDYNHINGRFIVHCITTLFCCFIDMNVFRVINSVLFIVLIRNIDRILIYEGYKFYYNKYIIAFCLFFIFPVPGEVLVGHIATCINYMWVACATTYFIILLHRTDNKKIKWYYNVLLFIVACVIGSLQESYSIGISGALFISYFFKYSRFKQSNKCLVLGYWIGTCILTFAPGNFTRLASSDGGNIFSGLAKLIINSGYLITSSWMFLIMLFSLILLYIKNRDLFYETTKKNLIYILSIIFSSVIVCIIFTGERQLFAIEMFSLIITIQIINSTYYFKDKNKVRLIKYSMLIYCIIIYPFIYSARKEMYIAYTELQNSRIVEGVMYNQNLLKCTNKLYKNIFIRRFIFPHGHDLHGLSLLRSGGYDCNYIKVILPYCKEDLFKQFYKLNINGIYHNKKEKFCIIKGNNDSESCNIISYSEPSFLGSIRNYIFKGNKTNIKPISLTNYFYYEDQKYYIIYDSYMEVYNYTYAN